MNISRIIVINGINRINDISHINDINGINRINVVEVNKKIPRVSQRRGLGEISRFPPDLAGFGYKDIYFIGYLRKRPNWAKYASRILILSTAFLKANL